MIVTIILALIIFVLIAVLVFQDWLQRKERQRFINALIAKNPDQYRDLELTSKVKPIKTPQEKVAEKPDLMPENELTDEEFLKNIEKGIY